jgi:hypothetical protein
VKLRSLWVSVFLSLLLVIISVRSGSAQELQPQEPEWLRQMYSEGWQKVQEGVLQRDTGGGRFETFGYGAEGLQWLAQSYEQQLRFFEEKYDASPTEEVAELVDQLRDKVDSLNRELQQAPSAESFDGSVMEGCNISYDAIVYAGSLSSTQGVTAVAEAYLHNDCGLVGNTTAVASAQAYSGTVESYQTQIDPKNNGTWIDSHASASATGSTACESRAQASVEVSNPYFFYAPPGAVNIECPQPEDVSITGPSLVKTDYYGATCADVTWTASTSIGNTGYSYEWYIGTALEGTGPTLTKRYCNEDASVTVRVVASNNAGWVDEATFATTITHTGPVVASSSGPATVTTDYYSSSCVDITWTAGATGGHPGGYTYSWYIGSDPAVQSTGSTFTKSYCNTSQPVTVKVVAQDADGHTDDATTTTNVQHIGSMAVTISGPASVTTDAYSSDCASVTWTATAIGGHPDYSYSWYLDTGTTIQGTGSTFTKSYCSTSQPVTVRVVAQDSDGHTKDASFTTVFQTIGVVVASVSGPASVNTDYYSAACADVTWMASATGGHPGGYTYSWYIGAGTTVQGTGSSFTKSYCNTSQSVTVKVVVQDSDGHADSATFTTAIHYKGPVVASVNGPATATSDDYTSACAGVTWTASATGGHSGYTYTWYLGTGTTAQGTGSTFTKSYCSTSQSVTVKVVARDSDGHTDSATYTTNVQYRAAIVAKITGPATVTTTSTNTCADVTWTASATSSGHSGFTYKWYLGTGTTVQGTASTFTKRYCSTTQSVTVKLVASASDGHSDDVSFTTNITHSSTPLAASISGQEFVRLGSSGECKSLTWTASATGGVPAYTYSWYIGTSTTVQGTTSSFTKTFCGVQTINVKVTVKDAAAQAANATFTTDLYYSPTTTCTTRPCTLPQPEF